MFLCQLHNQANTLEKKDYLCYYDSNKCEVITEYDYG